MIVVNKPEGWTSHDVVAKMRGIAGTRRVGHLGTLDPIATGVLPVMIGQVTRLAQFWDKSEKAYEAVVRFGFATTSYDKQGDPVGPVTRMIPFGSFINLCKALMWSAEKPSLAKSSSTRVRSRIRITTLSP